MDRINEYYSKLKTAQDEAEVITTNLQKEMEAQSKNKPTINFDIKGTYQDAWFGDVEITTKNGQLWFSSKKSLLLNGPLYYLRGNTFIVKWTERSFDADAYVMFGLDKDGNSESFKMKAISPLTDFSFDFQDLDFHKK